MLINNAATDVKAPPQIGDMLNVLPEYLSIIIPTIIAPGSMEAIAIRISPLIRRYDRVIAWLEITTGRIA